MFTWEGSSDMLLARVRLVLISVLSFGVPLSASPPSQGPTETVAIEHQPSAVPADLPADLQRREYDFSPVPGESGVWSAPNRGHA